MSDFLRIFIWLLGLWLLGWISLPVAARLFPRLPDGGLAAGRVLTLCVISLLAFWLGALHFVPLGLAPFLFFLLPLASLAALQTPHSRQNFRQFLHERKSALVFSDVLFAFAFLFFVWVRMRHPELNDLEKPMDAALLGTTSRAQFLPPPHPWQSGTLFTNYYYFGHFMGAMLARIFGGPNWIVYNLVQPAFCAFFVSTLWSLCAALTKSSWRGIYAMSLVALLGHFEPLRQWYENKPELAGNLFRLDWWSTSRVVPNTINEYPAFTMLIGDAHAHFWALALAALFFCLCYSLFEPQDEYSHRPRLWILACVSILLGILTMTNTWDVPTYGLLFMLCWVVTLPRETKKTDWLSPRNLWLWFGLTVLPVVLSRVLAWPYLKDFHAPIHGVAFEIWSPDFWSFLLLWGGILLLWLLLGTGYILTGTYSTFLTFIPLLFFTISGAPNMSTFLLAAFVTALAIINLKVDIFITKWTITKFKYDKKPIRLKFKDVPSFLIQLSFIGVLALLIPMFFYIRGIFGDGDYRHQDTVFKFGLQAWLLLGTAAGCGAALWWSQWKNKIKIPLAILFPVVPLLCSWSVAWTRTTRDAPKLYDGKIALSLDGARHLPEADRSALLWLSQNAKNGDSVLEAISPDAYVEFGRVAALTGVPSPQGWPQHLRGWGSDETKISRRTQLIQTVWSWPSDERAKTALRELSVNYIFVGDLERRTYSPEALKKLRSALPIKYSQDDTFIVRVE